MKMPWESEEDAAAKARRRLAEDERTALNKLDKRKTPGRYNNIQNFRAGLSDVRAGIGDWNTDRKDRNRERWRKHPFIALLYHIFIWFGIPLFIIYLVWWSTTATGQAGVSEVEKQVPYLSDVWNSPALKSTVGKGLAILKGEYDPSNLWTSEQVQSKYSAAENLEVLIDDAGPTRNFFYAGTTDGSSYTAETIQLGGRINVIGGLEENTPIRLGVTPSWLCPEDLATGINSKIWDLLDGDEELSDDQKKELAGCSGGAWTCKILGEEPTGDDQNVFMVRNVYNRQFYCEHAGVNDVENIETISNLKIKWTYVGSAVAGKQIYVFGQDVVERYEDPIEQYEISEDTLKSWYIGEESINLALGLPLNNEYIRAYDPDLCDSEEDESCGFAYPLAVSIENSGAGEITKINELIITWPSGDGYIEGPEPSSRASFDKRSLNQFQFLGVLPEPTINIPLKTYKLRDGNEDWNLNKINEELKDDPLGPGEYITFYINIAVDKAYLGDASYQNFLVKAEVSYEYTNSKAVAVTVKPYPGAVSN